MKNYDYQTWNYTAVNKESTQSKLLTRLMEAYGLWIKRHNLRNQGNTRTIKSMKYSRSQEVSEITEIIIALQRQLTKRNNR
jgi:hypothetical protein